MVEDNKALDLACWVINGAINGVKVKEAELIPSVHTIVGNYLEDRGFNTDDERIDNLIAWQVAKNATTGFVAGLGGLITLPVAIPAAMASSWVIQARMAAAIAKIRGYDISDDRVQTFILISLVADNATTFLSNVGVKVGQKVGEQLIMQIPGKLLIEINKRVGFRLLTKAGEKGILNLTKAVPVLGGVVGGTIDGAACWTVGKAAKAMFPCRDATLASPV